MRAQERLVRRARRLLELHLPAQPLGRVLADRDASAQRVRPLAPVDLRRLLAEPPVPVNLPVEVLRPLLAVRAAVAGRKC